MLPKPRRPRERCIYPLSRVTYSVPEYCDITGLSREVVLRLMEDGSLPSVKIGIRRLILMRQLPQRNRDPRPSEKSN
jgi:excisionase family DNA binding protein